MVIEDWQDGVLGNTPLTAARLNGRDRILKGVLLQFAGDPSLMQQGAVTRDANGAATSFTVEWPDGVVGVYSGTPSAAFPGAVDAYTVTRPGSPTETYTQPAVTRDANGYITNRPAITVSQE